MPGPLGPALDLRQAVPGLPERNADLESLLDEPVLSLRYSVIDRLPEASGSFDGVAIDRAPTRERLVAAAMTLFGERGYRATTVGDIEQAAGLSRRAGAFYRHFDSKEAVFSAALDRWIAEVRAFPATVEALLPLGDLRAELTLIARGTLQLLDRQRDLFRLLARDAGEVPGLVARVHDDLVAGGYRQMVDWLRRVLAEQGRADDALEAVAAVALGALVHYRQDEALYGHPPAGADEQAFVAVWVDVWFRWLSA